MWKVIIIGQHVPQEGAITWKSDRTKLQMDEELQDIIYTQANNRELRAGDIYTKLQSEGIFAGKTFDRSTIVQSVRRRKRQIKTQSNREENGTTSKKRKQHPSSLENYD